MYTFTFAHTLDVIRSLVGSLYNSRHASQLGSAVYSIMYKINVMPITYAFAYILQSCIPFCEMDDIT